MPKHGKWDLNGYNIINDIYRKYWSDYCNIVTGVVLNNAHSSMFIMNIKGNLDIVK